MRHGSHVAARRRSSALAATLIVVLLGACGGSEPTGDATDDPSVATSPEADAAASQPEPDIDDAGNAGGDACVALTELVPLLGVIETGMTDDAASTAESTANALSLLESTDPPPELSTAWTDLTAFYSAVDAAFGGAEISPGQATVEVLGEAAAHDIPATVEQAVDGAKAVEGYVGAECESEASSTTTSEGDDVQLCAVLTEADLAAVFGESVPQLEDASWGPTTQECIWEASDGTTVSVMLISRSDFEREFLEPSGQAREVVDELENGELHEGTFGLGRFSTQGSSVYFTAGDWGGTANVRTGEDGDFAVDDPIAIDFAVKVASAIS